MLTSALVVKGCRSDVDGSALPLPAREWTSVMSAGLGKKKQRVAGMVALERGWHLPALSFSLAAVLMGKRNVLEAEEYNLAH